MISFTQIEYILAVERCWHFGKAATQCGVSQPSLSIQVQKAEEELGYLIFDREKKPVQATPKGVLFIAQAREVFAAYNKLIYDSRAEKNVVRGTLELGVIPTIMPFLVPLFIFRFSQNFPHVQLNVRDLTTELCIEGLRTGSLDAAVLAGPLHERGIKEKVLYHESFLLFAHPSSSLLLQDKVKPSDIHPSELWLLMDGHCFRNQVLAFCSVDQSLLNLKNVKLVGGSLEVLRRVVNSTWGYTLIPEMMLESLTSKEQQQQVRSFASPVPKREVSLAFSREQWKQDILEALHKTIIESLPKIFNQKFTANPIGNERLLDVHGKAIVR